MQRCWTPEGHELRLQSCNAKQGNLGRLIRVTEQAKSFD